MREDPLFVGEKRVRKLWLKGTPPRGYWWPEPPDQNIAPLIHALNALPFLYTHACCGGHIRTKKEMLGLLVGNADSVKVTGGEDFGCYSGAWFSFTTDGSEESERFVHTLRLLVAAWTDASFENLPGGEWTYGVNLTGADKNTLPKNFDEARERERSANERIARIIALIRRHAR